MQDERPDADRFWGDRSATEMVWVDLNGPLKAHGYRLRPRYQPDWVPSWQSSIDVSSAPPLFYQDYEDGLSFMRWNVVDAVREADGLPVMLKIIFDVDVNSVPFAKYFSQEPRRSDYRNHCAPLLDVLWFQEYPSNLFLVHPRYLPWTIWPFVRVGEVVDFLSQIFEGLSFMHENYAVHLDAGFTNIMMDGLHLLKEPNHPAKPSLKACAQGVAEHWERHESAKPVKYYFIDFDQSMRFPNKNSIVPIRRKAGQDHDAPELCSPPYDPFRLDVFCIGNMILTYILNAYENVEFVRPLAMDMTHPDPAKRPTAREVVARFEKIRQLLFPTELDQLPGFIGDQHWYPIGVVDVRDPPLRRRATVSGTRFPPGPFDSNASPDSSHSQSHSRSYSQF